MVYTLLRQFSDDVSLLHQRAMILRYLKSHNMAIDKEMIEFSSHGKSLEERKQFDDFLHSLTSGDIVVVDDVKTLGQDTEEILKVINCMLSRDVALVLAAVDLKIDPGTPIAKILPLIIDFGEVMPPKDRYAQKGRPKGSRSASKFDVYLDKIIALLKDGANVSEIARKLDVSRSSLKDYIESRQIKQVLDDEWIEQIYSIHDLRHKDVPEMVCTISQ